ncbi:protein FANTASTIC FOUR 3-like [Juglans microcarpa x Juglans regia]|uniref:protein FANTASTIC FOUR 3-like n=1 Tax=Juglans microcarpa x Juglans regia TaxID=2249226 RepID=UPI001B7F78DE|nr:protein FANTASTIC FOUR 3-like [Juglans microcarpa x Juglans regia]
MSLSGANSYGLSFVQVLTNNSHYSKEKDTENDKVYVHPQVRRSSLRLSEESLRMCTENLGSETGSACTESDIDEIDLFSVVSENGQSKKASKLHGFRVSKKLNHPWSFPPPLKSISSSSGVRVKSHREGGRLVLKAFTVPSCRGLFHAERGDGRLRIRMVQGEGIGEDGDEEVAQEAEPETEDAEEELEEAEVGEDRDSSDEKMYWCEEEERSGITVGFGPETAIGRLPRPSRCMEGGTGNKALLYLEPFWKAAYKLSV